MFVVACSCVGTLYLKQLSVSNIFGSNHRNYKKYFLSCGAVKFSVNFPTLQETTAYIFNVHHIYWAIRFYRNVRIRPHGLRSHYCSVCSWLQNMHKSVIELRAVAWCVTDRAEARNSVCVFVGLSVQRFCGTAQTFRIKFGIGRSLFLGGRAAVACNWPHFCLLPGLRMHGGVPP